MELSFVLAEIRKKNRAVFKKVFEQYYSGLVYYACNYIHDLAQCEDLVQDSFVYLWENADRLHIKTSIKGYLYTMVRNRCLNALKSVDITDDLHFTDFYVAVTEEHNPLIAKEEFEKREAFLRAVVKMADTFPPQMQKVFRLWYFKQYPYKKIAEELKISVSSVKSHLKAAQDKIAGLSPDHNSLP